MELSCGINISISTVGANADECLDFARKELEAHLRQMFARLNVIEKKGEARFVLSVRDSPMLVYDGYQIVITETETRIISRCARGVLHGVYHVLRMLGCSFWFSKASCQNVPTVRRKTLAPGVHTENPLIEQRGIFLFGISKANLADALATVDFMAKNGYNLLFTTPKLDAWGLAEHNVCWDEMEASILPHLKLRGISLCLSLGSDIGEAQGLTAPDNLTLMDEDSLNIYLDAVCAYIKDRPYIKLLGPWQFERAAVINATDPDIAARTFKIISNRIKAVREDITIMHNVCATQHDELSIADDEAILLDKYSQAYNWAHGKSNAKNIYFLDKSMADSYYARANLCVLPHYCKQLISAAANAQCTGIVSIWAPISSWWAASLNFAIMSEAYYHPDFSVVQIIGELADSLWGACSVPLSKALYLTLSILQDKALWSRPPCAPEGIHDHIDHRNLVFDAQNAATYDKRYDDVMAIIDGVSIARLDEHGRYHLDCFKTYLALQKQYFHSIDQFSLGDNTQDRLKPYYALLKSTKKLIGEGFLSESYAKWRIEDKTLVK